MSTEEPEPGTVWDRVRKNLETQKKATWSVPASVTVWNGGNVSVTAWGGGGGSGGEYASYAAQAAAAGLVWDADRGCWTRARAAGQGYAYRVSHGHTHTQDQNLTHTAVPSGRPAESAYWQHRKAFLETGSLAELGEMEMSVTPADIAEWERRSEQEDREKAAAGAAPAPARSPSRGIRAGLLAFWPDPFIAAIMVIAVVLFVLMTFAV